MVSRAFCRHVPLFIIMAVLMLLIGFGWIHRVTMLHGPVNENSNSRARGQDILKKNFSMTKGLPKIIHQIWDDEIVPEEFVDQIQGLVKLNPSPEWKYYFWTLKAGEKFVERNYPNLMNYYSVSKNLMRANILRLLVIHHYGGLYFDLDTVAVKPLKPYVENTSCSVVLVTPEHYIDKDTIVRADLITNNVLMCQAGHPYFNEIIKLLEKQPTTCQYSRECTGPVFISHVFHEMRKKKETMDLLPRLESYQLFQDKIGEGSKKRPLLVCTGKRYQGAEVWRREMCDEWIRRGKSERSISKLAYTYHTWFHVFANKVTIDPKNVITNIVPHAVLYK